MIVVKGANDDEQESSELDQVEGLCDDCACLGGQWDRQEKEPD